MSQAEGMAAFDALSGDSQHSFDLALRELGRSIDGATSPAEASASVGSVSAMRATQPTDPLHTLHTPVLCVVAQGQKQVLLGDERIAYSAGDFLLNSVTLPATGHVIGASPEAPCLWMVIELDPALVGSVIVEAGLASPHPNAPLRAMEAGRLTRPLLDGVVRLARGFDSPRDAPFLAPLALREIIYHLGTGEQGARLHQIVAGGAQVQRVMRAIAWVRHNFDQPLSLDALAKEAGMSLSALHHHFKDVTALSPLQFQKQMRLQEAKRLMVSQDMDAASAGYKVGYDDASHFNRDYRRFFGHPPRQHIALVRGQWL